MATGGRQPGKDAKGRGRGATGRRASSKAAGAAEGSGTTRKPAAGRQRSTARKPTTRARGRRTAKAPAAEEVVRGLFAALAARDPDGMIAHWDPEGVDEMVPLGRVMRGTGEIRAMFIELFAAVPDLETTVEHVVSDERAAAVQWRMHGTFSGAPFQGLEPTGRRFELRGMDRIEVENGKVVRITAFYDGMAFARGIGMMPPRDSAAERALYTAFNAVTKVRERLNTRQQG